MVAKITVTDQNIRDSRAKIDTAIRKKFKGELTPGFDYRNICPIALAAREVIAQEFWPKIRILKVGFDYNLCIDDDCVVLPDIANKFVDFFDAKKIVSPISFDLEIPAAYLKQN